MVGDDLHYRRKARLGVKHVFKKGTVLVGFRERASAYIADMRSCQTLDARFSALLPLLRDLILGMSCSDRLPQIEVAAGDEQLVLVFRHLVPLSADDEQALTAFGQRHQVQIYTQSKGPDTVIPLWPQSPPIPSYHLPEFSLEMLFRATDFIQVNAAMNRRMVSLAVELMGVAAEDKILDLFCGLGNFTLPLARQAAFVIGVESNDSLLEHARRNARHNGIDNVEFRQADLYDESARPCWGDFNFNKMLLDPPRDGALHVIRQLPKKGPERIVYISCNPVTLARDTEHLVNIKGYRLRQAGIMDMFPHTHHVESIAVFER
jgi:23S rRNA (uracil1939-C5)-methyltransferase